VVDQASLLAYENCATQADQTGCLAYDTAAMCLGQEVEAGASGNPESICLATTFEEFYFAIVPLFCGEGSADGGPPVTDAGGAAGDAAVEDDSGSGADARASESADAGVGVPPQDAGVPGAAEGGDAR